MILEAKTDLNIQNPQIFNYIFAREVDIVFRIYGSGLGFMVQGFRVSGFGFRALGIGFRV